VPNRIEVFYDGRCGLCAASRRWAEARDRSHRLAFRDFTDPAHGVDLPFPAAELTREMVVRTLGGRLARGFAGWLEVLGALPRWRWLATLLDAPPLRWLGTAGYRLVARHRNVFPMAIAGGPSGEACSIKTRSSHRR
jgi:predicted DCC family thiol-disulfide oxidoreductase YuxK